MAAIDAELTAALHSADNRTRAGDLLPVELGGGGALVFGEEHRLFDAARHAHAAREQLEADYGSLLRGRQ